MKRPLIAITMGDPCGIGPEIIVRALSEPQVRAACRPLVLGDAEVLERAIGITRSKLRLYLVDKEENAPQDRDDILPLHTLSNLLPNDREFGQPTSASGDAVYKYITEAAKLCISGAVAGMATAPINKEALNRAGHHYPGHTELLAELTGSNDFVMMLAGERLRVALVTIHEAISRVPQLLTIERVLSTIKITHQDVQRYFKPNPRIAVLSLNPHCGEGGLFGDEESRVIQPAVLMAQAAGINAVGPLSADTLFHFAAMGEYDAVICMYHDQGLIPLKLLHFDDGVNVTLGIPIIRTSVDHGTAYNLAGTGNASAASMIAAICMAARMAMQNAGLAAGVQSLSGGRCW